MRKFASHPICDYHIYAGIEHTAVGYNKCPSAPIKELKHLEDVISYATKIMSQSDDEDVIREADELNGVDIPVSDLEDFEDYTEVLESTVNDMHNALCDIHAKISLVLSSGEMSDEVAEILEEALNDVEDNVMSTLTYKGIKDNRLNKMHVSILESLGMSDATRFIYDIKKRSENKHSHYYINEREGCNVRWDGTCLSFESEEGIVTVNQTHVSFTPSTTLKGDSNRTVVIDYNDLIQEFEDFLTPTEAEMKMFEMIHGAKYPFGYLKARCNF